MIWERLAICIAASAVFHFALAEGLDQLPPVEKPRPKERVQVRIVEPPKKAPLPEPQPEPEPPKPEVKPEPPKPEPKVVHEAKPAPVQATKVAPQPVEAPPTDTSPTTTDTTPKRHFGVKMESTSQAGHGPELPVGNTTKADPSTATPGTQVKQLAEPTAAYQVTKMPLPLGRCTGVYTEAAKQAGIEGVVVLDVVVDETGHTRDIQVVTGLGGGLTDAAIAALLACTFKPGERDGHAVAVRVRGFKIRFVLQDAQ